MNMLTHSVESNTMTDYVYVLRCVKEDMTSAYGFKWPTEGYVETPDWNPEPKCGKGLHGFLWGEVDLSIRSAQLSEATSR